MKTYKFRFTREVIQTDTFYREIRANSLAGAKATAAGMAEASNRDCPDDASQEGSDECGSWSAELVN